MLDAIIPPDRIVSWIDRHIHKCAVEIGNRRTLHPQAVRDFVAERGRFLRRKRGIGRFRQIGEQGFAFRPGKSGSQTRRAGPTDIEWSQRFRFTDDFADPGRNRRSRRSGYWHHDRRRRPRRGRNLFRNRQSAPVLHRTSGFRNGFRLHPPGADSDTQPDSYEEDEESTKQDRFVTVFHSRGGSSFTEEPVFPEWRFRLREGLNHRGER